MTSMSFTVLIGLLLGAAFGLALAALVAAILGWHPRLPVARSDRSVLFNSAARRRLALAGAVALLVGAITRWPVAAIVVGALIYLWPTMFGAGRQAATQMERLEALTVWTESLRDSIAGSIGLEEAIRHSLSTAPTVLRPALQRLDARVRVQLPLTHALAEFARELPDSSSDLVISALVLNSQLRGKGLVHTLTALASAARDEIDMRRRIEEGRKSLRRTALIIVAATSVFAGAMAVFSRDYVAPYSSPLGQVMLAVVLGVFGAGLMWIRAAANLPTPAPFLADVDQIDKALAGSARAGGVR